MGVLFGHALALQNEARNSEALFKFVRDVANSPAGAYLIDVPSHAGIDPIRWGNN
jgi:hypothetical protein